MKTREEVKEFLDDVNLLVNEVDLQKTIEHVTGKEFTKERALKNVISWIVGNVYELIEHGEVNRNQDNELSFIIQQLVDIRQADFISDYELELSINESLSIIAGIFGLNPIYIKQVE